MHFTMFQGQNMTEKWDLMNPQGNEWNPLYLKNHEVHIAGKGYTSMTHYNYGSHFYSYATSDENSGCKSCSG